MLSDEEILIGLGVGALLMASSSKSSSKSSAAASATEESAVYVARWPIPTMLVSATERGADKGKTVRYGPSVSDGLHLDGKPRFHPGVDLAYKRTRKRGSVLDAVRGGIRSLWDERHFDSLPYASPGGWYFCPRVPVSPVHVGRVWHASVGAPGGQVVVDHGSFVSIYLHLQRLNVPLVRGGVIQEGARKGQGLPVGLSTILGAVGADPRQGSSGFNHLHLELVTYHAGKKRYHDAAPLLAQASEWVIELTEGQTTLEP